MSKWGIRLIGFFFLSGALWDLYKLFTDRHNAIRFMGLSGGISYGDNYVEILAWIVAGLFAYIGYHLFRLHADGRTWALIILWPSAILSGIYFVFFIVLPIVSLTASKEISMGLYLSNKSIEIKDPLGVLLILGFSFLFYAAQVWFLMRQDVKSEFRKSEGVKQPDALA